MPYLLQRVEHIAPIKDACEVSDVVGMTNFRRPRSPTDRLVVLKSIMPPVARLKLTTLECEQMVPRVTVARFVSRPVWQTSPLGAPRDVSFGCHLRPNQLVESF